jgi:hypothetical protein
VVVVVVHLQLENNPEEEVHVARVGVHQDVVDSLLLNLAQNRSDSQNRRYKAFGISRILVLPVV